MDNEVIPQVNISSEHGLRKIDFIDNDFAIFNDAWDIPMDEYPNRINAAVIAVCLAGEGTVCINLQEYKLTAGNLLMTLPEQIIQSLGRSDDFSGVFIAVSPQFIDRTFTQMKELLSFMFYAPSLVGNAYFIWKVAFSGDSYGYINSLLLSIGIIGIYLMNILNEAKKMPHYVIRQEETD